MRSLAQGAIVVSLLGTCAARGADLPDNWELVQLARPGQGGLPWQLRFDQDTPALNRRGDWAIGTDRGVLVNGVLLDGGGYNRSHSGLSINDLGTVVWAGSVSTGQGGVFSYDTGSGTGGFVTNGPDTRYSKRNPVINNAGLVVYGGAVDGHESINAHDLATGQSRIVVQGDGWSVRLGDRAALNNAGQIAYYDEGHDKGLKRLEPDGTTTMLPTAGAWWTYIDLLWMNDLGQVAAMPGEDVLLRSGDDGAERLVDLTFGGIGSDLFRRIEPQVPIINDEGWVAFRAELLNGTDAVYMADGDSFARVAGVGDPILTDMGWGTVQSLQRGGVSLNDTGDVLLVVDVDLAGGGGLNDVLVMATVPGPGPAAFAVPALALLAARARRPR
ncbi:MAG TPA: choice-of-anchor tandem repeat NxxGxxAF-containing protein [Phycisphaerales bacterium]|nr:choice-of-anchor tandem repeat NxxGxxAF-containing protein [Phycisphaerales bacterium]